MAAGSLAPPGTQFGPCKDECQHIDCTATRAMAASLCVHCGKPIGYDVMFYDVRSKEKRTAQYDGESRSFEDALAYVVAYWSRDCLAHAHCEERLALVERQARSHADGK